MSNAAHATPVVTDILRNLATAITITLLTFNVRVKIDKLIFFSFSVRAARS